MIAKSFKLALAATLLTPLAACGINSVPTAEENAKAKWADVQAAFQARANLIPALQEIVLSSSEQERETLNDVISARARATSPQIQLNPDDLSDPAKVAAFQAAQGQLSSSLGRLLATVEAYPELKSQDNYGRFMNQYEGSENKIRIALKDYNESVREYNTTIRTFPDIIGAKIIHGAKPMVTYDAPTEGAEVGPTLDMRKK
jgi:LemA protein